jgi:hypothetical protein
MGNMTLDQKIQDCALSVARWWTAQLVRPASPGQPLRTDIPQANWEGFRNIMIAASEAAIRGLFQPTVTLGAFRKKTGVLPEDWRLAWPCDPLVMMLMSAGITPDILTLPWVSATVVSRQSNILGASGVAGLGRPTEHFFQVAL